MTMTTFGWKRKAGQAVCKKTSAAFEENTAKEEDDESLWEAGIDWIHLLPKRKVVCLEDNTAKSSRLREEGAQLASEERFWEAIKKWDSALEYNPSDEKIYEMKAQAYMTLCEVFPAVQSAQKSVNLKPSWWSALQTLGRAQLGLGEVRQALRSFSKAVHLHPVDEELWKEDLWWAHSLLERKRLADEEKARIKEERKRAKIVELNEEDGDGQQLEPYVVRQMDSGINENPVENTTHHGKISSTYVQLRD